MRGSATIRSLSTLPVVTAQDPSPIISRALFSVNATSSAQGTRLESPADQSSQIFVHEFDQAGAVAIWRYGVKILPPCSRRDEQAANHKCQRDPTRREFFSLSMVPPLVAHFGVAAWIVGNNAMVIASD